MLKKLSSKISRWYFCPQVPNACGGKTRVDQRRRSGQGQRFQILKRARTIARTLLHIGHQGSKTSRLRSKCPQTTRHHPFCILSMGVTGAEVCPVSIRNISRPNSPQKAGRKQDAVALKHFPATNKPELNKLVHVLRKAVAVCTRWRLSSSLNASFNRVCDPI